MATKASLSGVTITDSKNNTYTSNSNGEVTLNLNSSTLSTITYSKSGYENLIHKYSNVKDVKKLILYLEKSTAGASTSKNISGKTLKEDSRSSGYLPIKNIEITETNQNVTTTSNKSGYFELNKSSSKPKLKFEYYLNKNNYIFGTEYVSSIKDSSDVDIVFDEAVGGIN